MRFVIAHPGNPRQPIMLQVYVDGKIIIEEPLTPEEAWKLGVDLVNAALKDMTQPNPITP